MGRGGGGGEGEETTEEPEIGSGVLILEWIKEVLTDSGYG